MRYKAFTIVIICLQIVCISLNVFSANEINSVNTDLVNGTNEIVNKTLEEQKQEVDKQLEESNTKLEYVQSELGATLQKVLELDDSITDYQNQFDSLQTDIYDLEQKINNTKEVLEELEDTYNRKEKTLKKRIVALYEAGDISYIDLLLSSDSIVDFLSNYFMIGELLEYDNNLLEEIENMQNRMEETKKMQEEQQTELKVARSKILETQIQLENTKIVKENYMTMLNEQEIALQVEIAQYKASQEELEKKIAEARNWQGVYDIQFTGGIFIWPVAMQGTYITSSYGNRLHPIQGVYKDHDGIDISGPNINGGPAVAAADGVVTYAGWISGYGNCVIINHGSGIITLYGHGQETIAKTGDVVKQGDVILKIGSTGNSTGPHLHFEVRKNGVAVDPIPYLTGEISSSNGSNSVATNQVDTIVTN